jgi:hypothetical protein
MKYVLLGIIIYWIVKRVFRISKVVQNQTNSPQNNATQPTNNRKNNTETEREYVDYEEFE